MRRVLSSLLALSLLGPTAVALSPAIALAQDAGADAGAPRGLGTYRRLADAGTCGGSLAANQCAVFEVSCNSAEKVDAGQAVSTLNATVKVTDPSSDGGVLDGGPPRGTLVTHAGGGVSGAWEAYLDGSNQPVATTGVLQPALDRGRRVAQVMWAQGTNTNGVWGGSAGPNVDGGFIDGGPIDGGFLDGGTLDGAFLDGGPIDGGWLDGGPIDGGVVDASFGGDMVPDTPPDRACLEATLLQALHDDSTIFTNVPGVTTFEVAGQSGGNAIVVYAMAWYGSGNIIDCFVGSGGPPIALIEQGCMGTLDPTWATECASYTGTGSLVCGYNDSAVSAQFIDNIANDGRRHCALKAKGGPVDWASWSAVGGAALKSFPNTAITIVDGLTSSGESEPIGRGWASRVTDLSGGHPTVVITASSCGHTVPGCSTGASAINTALAGGVYNGTTLTACTSHH